ncbi:MAG: DUF4405 domain-containing protein [Desulfarculus sp.]|nr:DUF4405 domain-containing protein [Pseudomonadota bacterium]MBV1716101.1 DUF4405 domain-containing protein [Desulfarculus sp.]MBU4574824.1 DUF4405 domain-containing protein [Pseudomonadota bacterium]MBU4596383.1 DUF4405 domain-containing protein [Pseudomonadota bacterium]MBV1738176.1 DUF4405 domain-containing protein [Desulfarculus sp.]
MSTAKASFSHRGLTSLLGAAGLVVMGISGLVAYLMPQGRIAYWNDWYFWGLTKTQWGNIHIISSILFLVAMDFHLYFNWKPFISYLKGKAAQMKGHKRELWIALAALVLVVAAGIRPFPPLSWLVDLNTYLKNYWVSTPAHEPPFGHAEELTLQVFCKKVGIPAAPAMALLKQKGWQGVSPQARVIDIARLNRTAPMALYALIKPLEKAVEAAAPAGHAYTTQEVEERFAGTGIGNKTLAEVAQAAGQAPATVAARLKAAGLTMKADQTLKAAAQSNGLASPLEMLKAMLVEGYRPQR